MPPKTTYFTDIASKYSEQIDIPEYSNSLKIIDKIFYTSLRFKGF